MAPPCARGYHVPYLAEIWGGAVRRVWLRVALAAGAGLASLVVCCGAVLAIIGLFIASIQFGWIGSSLDPIYFWLGVGAALMFAGASLSPPPLLGAGLNVSFQRGQALIPTSNTHPLRLLHTSVCSSVLRRPSGFPVDSLCFVVESPRRFPDGFTLDL